MNDAATMLPGGDPLAGLRDIHLPPEPGWWPPAPGWWLLAALAIGAIVALVVAAGRRWRAGAARREARRILVDLQSKLAAGEDPRALISQLSALLRRVAMARYPRAEVAGLTGSAWLDFLDNHGGGGEFTDGVGACLAVAPYRPTSNLDPAPVLALVRQWVERNA